MDLKKSIDIIYYKPIFDNFLKEYSTLTKKLQSRMEEFLKATNGPYGYSKVDRIDKIELIEARTVIDNAYEKIMPEFKVFMNKSDQLIMKIEYATFTIGGETRNFAYVPTSIFEDATYTRNLMTANMGE